MPASVRSAASSLSPRMDLTGNLHSTLTAPTASLLGSCPFASNGTPSSPRSHCRTRAPFPRPFGATAHSDRPAKDRSLSHLLGVRGRAVSGWGSTLEEQYPSSTKEPSHEALPERPAPHGDRRPARRWARSHHRGGSRALTARRGLPGRRPRDHEHVHGSDD